ncbi:MAG TPA: MFS transporter [Kribbella sp.]|nr:MFS transporter [Kribbella sp.]
MFTRSSVTVRPVRGNQSRHRAIAAGIFLVLGFHVGVWAVQLAGLSAALQLSPGLLGTALTTASATGIVTLFAGGRLADRLGRRPVLLLGFVGTALAFALLSQVGELVSLFVVLAAYGLFVSFVDLAANAVGADYEHTHGVQAMTGLHAGFSFGATLGAVGTGVVLWAGVDFRAVYLGLAVVLAAAAVLAMLVPLPSPAASEPTPAAGGGAVWRIPAVAFAIVLVTVTMFGDGALESFLAVYLSRALASGVLLSGIGVASFHLASLAGRLLASRALRRWGERRVVVAAGLLAAGGISVAVSTSQVVLAIGGLLLVGFAVSPVMPTAFSLAARSAPGQSGRAVARTTAAGYSAFIVSPVLVGRVADASSLRVGLGLLIATALAIAALGRRWPQGEAPVGPDSSTGASRC